ncbi:cell division protein ZapA [Aquabacterium sp. A7-Y]|uniref:cell division protein ZapA n=1 Tax=Aquabacterium sp. A7-Y TaxID=1349605 RepID=UPI00223E5417|nr:cell division protein ZapA [Aquabacterium sp. A7-Y]MCW7537561.1 cell division protein ZapA [Aquabacterium sp. A7-Y]
MKQIEVTIMGQSYILGCAEGGESALLEAVNHVDREMCSIRDAGKVKARERIAVLAALNLAFELAQRPPSAAPPRSAPISAAPAGASTDVEALVRRIDEALGQDGQLI